MLFMVIERFAPGRQAEVYRLVRERGRLLPDGLVYVDSWITADFARCFQLMECAEVNLLQEWVAEWGDLIEFEIVAVSQSSATGAMMARLAETSSS